MLQDLDSFLAVLAGTRKADGSPRLVKRDKSILGEARMRTCYFACNETCLFAALQSHWLMCSVCALARFCTEQLPLQDFLDETE